MVQVLQKGWVFNLARIRLFVKKLRGVDTIPRNFNR